MTKILKILYVEETNKYLKALKRFIAKDTLPYELISANSGIDAREKYGSTKFDLVLCEYHRDNSTTFDLIDKLGNPPLIILSEVDTGKNAVQALKAGAADYLFRMERENILKFCRPLLKMQSGKERVKMS